MALLALLVLTAAWVALPFVPAVLELARATDAAPLVVVGSYDGDIRHFARGLRSYLASQLPRFRPLRRDDGTLEGTFADGTGALLIKGRSSPVALHGHVLTRAERDDRLTDRLVVSYGPLMVPRQLTAVGEIYTSDALLGGPGTVYRAVLADRHVLLAPGSVVLRWVHAEGSLVAEQDCTLYGRASSEQGIQLGVGCRFERMFAPSVQFGGAPGAARPDAPDGGVRRPYEPPSPVDVAGGRWLVHGDLTVPPGSLVACDLVATGDLTVGAGTVVRGSLKSGGRLSLGDGVVVRGSVIAVGDVTIGRDGDLHGPVVSERHVEVSAGTRIGTPRQATTLSAPTLRVFAGAVVHGTVWAREHGTVVA